MDNINHLFDLPSPTNSVPHVFRDAEQYLDTPDSQSSINSPSDLAYMAEFSSNENASGYPSPGREEDELSQSAQQQQKQPPKRKRENRYKNAPPQVLSRRRAQNRASQRAYRERKDQRIKDLEQELNEYKQRNDVLNQAYVSLHAAYLELKAQQQLSKDQQHHHHSYAPNIAYDATTMGLTNNNRLDLDMYVYPDLHNYSL